MRTTLELVLHVIMCTALFLLAIPIVGVELIFRAISRGTEYVANLAEALAVALLIRSGF